MIRRASANDIPAIAAIHSTALPADLLPRLGSQFLNKVFYPGAVKSNHALVLVHEELGTIYSFVVFAYDSRKLIEEVIGNRIVFSIYVLAALTRNITLARDLYYHIKGFRTEMYVKLDVPLDEIPELFVMASAPQCQSQGWGGKLLDSGLDILLKEHASCLVKTSSSLARQFYEKHHFSTVGVEYRGRRQVYLLLRN